MTYKTHRVYSVSFALLGAMLLNYRGLTEINYYLSLVIMLMISKRGALFPDIDHNWQNVKDKTIPNYIINQLIHKTGGKHRSWQTHSIDICIIFTVISVLLPDTLFSIGIVDVVDKEVLSILLLGFSTGWISHLFSDMLTSEGVRLFCFNKLKVKFVPKKLFGFRFNTGDTWEEFNYTAVKLVNILLGLVALLFPYLEQIILKVQTLI